MDYNTPLHYKSRKSEISLCGSVHKGDFKTVLEGIKMRKAMGGLLVLILAFILAWPWGIARTVAQAQDDILRYSPNEVLVKFLSLIHI